MTPGDRIARALLDLLRPRLFCSRVTRLLVKAGDDLLRHSSAIARGKPQDLREELVGLGGHASSVAQAGPETPPRMTDAMRVPPCARVVVCASHLAMRGVAMRAIQDLMGHQTITMTMRYAHLMPGATRAAVATLDQPAPDFGQQRLRSRASPSRKKRKRMGIEPTEPPLSRSPIGFEDRGRHQSCARFRRRIYTRNPMPYQRRRMALRHRPATAARLTPVRPRSGDERG